MRVMVMVLWLWLLPLFFFTTDRRPIFGNASRVTSRGSFKEEGEKETRQDFLFLIEREEGGGKERTNQGTTTREGRREREREKPDANFRVIFAGWAVRPRAFSPSQSGGEGGG